MGWDFEGYIHLTSLDLGSDFYAFIIKQDSWKHLAAENGNVQLPSTGNNSSDPKQIWHFIRMSDGSYKIVNEFYDMCMDAANFGTSNGTNVGLCTSNDSTAQRWFISTMGNGYALSPAYTSMVIDVTGGVNDPGTNVQLWQSGNTSAQAFSIYKLTEDGVTYSKPAKPSAVTVNASVSANKVLSISWSQSPLKGSFDARAYDVYIYKDSASSTPIHTKMSLSATSYTYSLPSEGTYYVKVAAVNTKYYGWYTFSSTVKVETKSDLLGDMDGDASITVSDALAALRIAARLASATSSVKKIADVDFDGTITVSDALAILRVAARLAGTKTLTVQSLSSCTLYPECYKNYAVSSNYTDARVEWLSSDASVATVGSNGKVTAKSAGTATITAKVSVIGQQKSVSYTVTVKNPSVVLAPASQSTSYDAYSNNRVIISGHIAYKCPLPSVTTDVNEAYCGDSRVSTSSITKEITSGDGKFSGEYFYSYQPGTIKIKYSFSVAGKTYSSTYTCNLTLTRTNPDMGQYIRSSTSTSSTNLGMVPANTTYVITQVAVTGTVGESGCQVWGYTTYGGVSGWTLIEYWQ